MGQITVGSYANNGYRTFRVIAIAQGWAWVRPVPADKEGPLTFRVESLNAGPQADAA